MFKNSMKLAKAFVVGDSDIKGEESSSDEEDDYGKNVNVFFFDSEQKKEQILKETMVKLIKQVKKKMEEDRLAKEQQDIQGEGLENQDFNGSEEEPLIDDVVSASHSPSEDEKDIPKPPFKPILPPYNYKELKTLHYAKFFTSCIFTPEQQVEMCSTGVFVPKEEKDSADKKGIEADKLTLPSILKFFTFYYFFRMCLLDVCYLTLADIPTLQILLPLFIEGIFIMVVIVGARKTNVFGSKFVIFRLVMQGVSIFMWLLMAYMGTLKSEKIDYRGFRKKEFAQALPYYLSVFMEWLTVFLIMLMLGTEVVWSLTKLYIVGKAKIKEFIQRRREKKERKRRKLERETGHKPIINQDQENYFAVQDNEKSTGSKPNLKRQHSKVRHTRVQSGFMEDSLRAMKKTNPQDQQLGEDTADSDNTAPEINKQFKEDIIE